jgi:dihydropyrimidinase
MSVAYERWRGWADPKVNCDYALHATITSWNDQTAGEMKRMVEEHGINSFKFFMAYKGALSLDDVSMYKAFETARDLGALCIVHA